MVKGSVTNNTGRSRHIFKRTVYPGQSVDLGYVYKILEDKVPTGESFVQWLEDEYLPQGWEVDVVSMEAADCSGGRPYKEMLTAIPAVAEASATEVGSFQENNEGQEPPNVPNMEFATPPVIRNMKASDIYNLRLRDNPKRILGHITSIHKLRRALTLCKNDSRKAILTRLVQGRIRELNVTL